MPGPRSKGNKTKQTKGGLTPKLEQGRFGHLVDDIDGADGWNAVVNVLCDYFQLPDLTTRSGLKRIFANFDTFYQRLDDAYIANVGNEKVTGGIVGIYTKMCADSILRTKLFEKGLLLKIMPLVNKPTSHHLALRALTTVTHHGGMDVRKEIGLKATPILLSALQNHPEDLKAAELIVSTLAHSFGSILNDVDKPSTKDIKQLKVPTMIRLVTDLLRKPGISTQLLDHAVELITQPTLHCWKDCKAYPPMISLLVGLLRSTDLSLRCMALGGLLRLEGSIAEDDTRFRDPQKLIAAVQRKLPPHLADIIINYGHEQSETTLTLGSYVDNQKTFMQYAQDRDLYALGTKLASFITKTEFSIADGMFQTQDPRTGRMEEIDLGLPFKRWADALPHCAKAIREKGRAGEEDWADMLEIKHHMVRSRVSEAVILAKKAVERNPKLPYFHYVITLGADVEEGLRSAKKGMKCKKITPFVRFAMMCRAVEIAGNLGVCRLQEGRPGDKKWEEGVAFLVSALEDAKTYVSQAPPDGRHMTNVLYWYIVLTLAFEGPKMAPNLSALQDSLRKLQVADEFQSFMAGPPPKTQLRLAEQNIVKTYGPATKEWSSVVAYFDSLAPVTGPEGHSVISTDKAEDDLSTWLDELRLDSGALEEPHPTRCSHPKVSPNSVELYRCSYCRNPSAVLKKCSGCTKARYCDSSCQKSHWSDHKVVCKS